MIFRARLSPFGIPDPAFAAGTSYVDNGSPACSNSGPGTEANPYCTISAAIAARGGPGTTILVKPGVYRETVMIGASGASGSPLVIQALGSGVVVDGSDDSRTPRGGRMPPAPNSSRQR